MDKTISSLWDFPLKPIKQSSFRETGGCDQFPPKQSETYGIDERTSSAALANKNHLLAGEIAEIVASSMLCLKWSGLFQT